MGRKNMVRLRVRSIQKKCSVKLVVRTSERATPLSLEQQQEKDRLMFLIR